VIFIYDIFSIHGVSKNGSKKRLRNVPILHDEVKAKRTVLLTPTAWNKIKLLSAEKGISASELIESWARNLDCN
jgi:hypothetical protein